MEKCLSKLSVTDKEVLFNKYFSQGVVFSQECLEMEDWTKLGSPHVLRHVMTVDNYEYYIDTAYSYDVVWDGKELHVHSRGVFLKDFVFLSSYYGYEEGAVFKRCK